MKNIVNELNGARVLSRVPFAGKLTDTVARAVDFIEKNQVLDVALWKKFVEVFRRREDNLNKPWTTWRSEFWGKMMRGASMVLTITKSDALYAVLEDTVRDILSTEAEEGRISGYAVEGELDRWDIWGRKYVMLGMLYFMEHCRDAELEKTLVASLKKQADYLLARLGEGEGKRDIRECSRHWEGLNSCSVLEPIVRIYRLTGEKKYLDFAEYIISTGFIKSANIIELAYADEVSPYQYPVVKAYEMMSCFEGLLQYYCLTGEEKYKTALLNLGNRILTEEQSIIGCSGCTHELFDHTAVRQTQTDYEDIVQETCVTVTFMKFALALLELSGDVRYADAIETSFYNAYLGSFNIHRKPSTYKKMNDTPTVLPFDSYSPLVADTRGRKVGGYDILFDNTFYGCCACIGAAGVGVIPQVAALARADGIVLNYYEEGSLSLTTPAGNPLTVSMHTAYPYDGRVELTLTPATPERFALTLRVPAWCTDATLTVDGKESKLTAGYQTVTREWSAGDTVVLSLAMPVVRVLPPVGAVNEALFAGYRRGPLVLAADRRLTDPEAVLDIACDTRGHVEAELVACPEIPEARICVSVPLTDGTHVRLIDYASAGKTYDEESRCAAWLYRKQA
ncbi:MAG: glycoside hydrolase family 127 protein [Clostridia bacterium]|nr:glycoside hydrolase family 127 protein [Clostridia bacterium]